MMKSFRTVITLVAALLVAGAAFAQSRGAGRIAGKIIDEAGQPVADVVVRAQKTGETDIFDAKSNKKGEWAIARVASGEWKLEFAKEGLAPTEMTTQVSEMDRGNMLTVTMKKPAAAVDPNVAINQELQRAADLLKTNDTAGARTIYLALLEKHPQVYQFPFFVATTYAAEKNYPKAMEYIKIAGEKDPNSVEVKLLTAEIMMEMGDKAGAKGILDAIDMTQVKDPFPFINAAINQINDGKGEEAIATLDKVIAQFPTNHMLYYYRGRANLASQKLDAAKADLEKFVSMAPADTKEVADAKKILEQMVKKEG
jgi:tetratricopeptide (TPR) repeat protein